ncbi:MAG: DUF4292 domain-containing protein [Rhizobacter sp.]|nr:DUF4292 domain-containing protein [Chlorobiales bacterium]
MYLRLIFFLLLVAAFAACSSQAVVTKSPADTSQGNATARNIYAQILRQSAMPLQAIETLEGDADIHFQSPQLTQSLGCRIRVRRPSASPQSASQTVGIQITGSLLFFTVLDAMITPDSIFAHNLVSGTLVLGKNEPDNLRKVTGITAGFPQMLDAFIGLPALAVSDSLMSRLQEVKSENGKLTYTFVSGKEAQKFILDSAATRTESIRLIDSLGQTRILMNFRKFVEVRSPQASLMLPQEIELVAYQYKPAGEVVTQQVVIEYGERQLNNPNFSFTFRRPQAAKTRRLEDLQSLF